MEAHSELWGEKRVSLKPPMDVPAIAWSHEAHSPRSYREKELALTKHEIGKRLLIRRLVTASGHMKEGLRSQRIHN
jgi:hypothetical protein